MKYAIELLRVERDRLMEEFNQALNKDVKDVVKDWGVICRNERLIEDLNKAIALLFMES